MPGTRDDIVTGNMTPEDRDLLLSLRRQQADLQQTLERLNTQLSALESRADAALPEIQHTLDVQFKRIAAIQAELDLLKKRK